MSTRCLEMSTRCLECFRVSCRFLRIANQKKTSMSDVVVRKQVKALSMWRCWTLSRRILCRIAQRSFQHLLTACSRPINICLSHFISFQRIGVVLQNFNNWRIKLRTRWRSRKWLQRREQCLVMTFWRHDCPDLGRAHQCIALGK